MSRRKRQATQSQTRKAVQCVYLQWVSKCARELVVQGGVQPVQYLQCSKPHQNSRHREQRNRTPDTKSVSVGPESFCFYILKLWATFNYIERQIILKIKSNLILNLTPANYCVCTQAACFLLVQWEALFWFVIVQT